MTDVTWMKGWKVHECNYQHLIIDSRNLLQADITSTIYDDIQSLSRCRMYMLESCFQSSRWSSLIPSKLYYNNTSFSPLRGPLDARYLFLLISVYCNVCYIHSSLFSATSVCLIFCVIWLTMQSLINRSTLWVTERVLACLLLYTAFHSVFFPLTFSSLAHTRTSGYALNDSAESCPETMSSANSVQSGAR